MGVKSIDTWELRRMSHNEGLILQGCGGDLTEWVNGINELLTEGNILKDGTKFKEENCRSFQHDGLTCLLFPFAKDVKLDMGRLAIWRLQTHGEFGGTWLSDYVPNKLGGFVSETAEKETVRKKPDCELIGQDSNIYNLMGIASRTLKRSGMVAEATEMCSQIQKSGSYDEALNIIGEYVNITGPKEDMDEGEDEWMGMNL